MRMIIKVAPANPQWPDKMKSRNVMTVITTPTKIDNIALEPRTFVTWRSTRVCTSDRMTCNKQKERTEDECPNNQD